MHIDGRYAVFVFSKYAVAPDPGSDDGKYSIAMMYPVYLYSLYGKRGKRALAALERVSR